MKRKSWMFVWSSVIALGVLPYHPAAPHMTAVVTLLSTNGGTGLTDPGAP
jgi:hypothetical protein